LLFSPMHATYLIHPHWLDHPNNIFQILQIMKMPYCVVFYSLLPLPPF
jgi:hypothetical protein